MIPQHPHATASIALRPLQRIERSLSYAWLQWPTAVFVVIVVLCLPWVKPEHRLNAIAALGNVILVAVLCLRFLTVNHVTGLLPTLFLTPIVIEASVSTIWFCIVNPSMYVQLPGGVIHLLDGNLHFQFVTMACIASYALPWLLLQRPGRETLRYDMFLATSRTFALPCFLVFIACILSLLTLRLLDIPKTTTLGYVVYGFFRYSHSLPMLAGAAWAELTRRSKWFVVAVLVLNALLNTLINSRYYAFMPVLFFSFGLLFLGRVPVSRKLSVMGLTLAALLVMIVTGNTGRRLGLGLWYGGTEDLQRRFEVLSQKSDMFWHERWADEVFGRLFFTGGHQITNFFPNTYPFKVPSWPYYAAEVITQGLLPRTFANWLVPPYHEEKSSLLLMGHRLTDKHGVERSFMGAAWELGGYPPLIVISLLASCFLLLMLLLIEKLYPQCPYWILTSFTILCDSVLWSMNEGVPTMAHEYIYSFIVALPVYVVAWCLGSMFLWSARAQVRRPVATYRVGIPA